MPDAMSLCIVIILLAVSFILCVIGFYREYKALKQIEEELHIREV